MIKQAIVKNKCYWVGFLLFVIAAVVFLTINGKASSFIKLNFFHNKELDIFFIAYTYVGDGLFALLLVAFYIIRLKKKKDGLLLLLSFLVSGVIAQIVKFFLPSPRPKLFFKPNEYTHFIEGVTHSNLSSFPSGHTTSAFALATLLVLLIENKKPGFQLLLLMLAILVGYSRIYLAQHFLGDVLIGAFIGATTSLIIYTVANRPKTL